MRGGSSMSGGGSSVALSSAGTVSAGLAIGDCSAAGDWMSGGSSAVSEEAAGCRTWNQKQALDPPGSKSGSKSGESPKPQQGSEPQPEPQASELQGPQPEPQARAQERSQSPRPVARVQPGSKSQQGSRAEAAPRRSQALGGAATPPVPGCRVRGCRAGDCRLWQQIASRSVSPLRRSSRGPSPPPLRSKPARPRASCHLRQWRRSQPRFGYRDLLRRHGGADDGVHQHERQGPSGHYRRKPHQRAQEEGSGRSSREAAALPSATCSTRFKAMGRRTASNSDPASARP